MQIDLLDGGLLMDLFNENFCGDLAHFEARRDHAGQLRRCYLPDFQPVKTCDRHLIGDKNACGATLLQYANGQIIIGTENAVMTPTY